MFKINGCTGQDLIFLQAFPRLLFEIRPSYKLQLGLQYNVQALVQVLFKLLSKLLSKVLFFIQVNQAWWNKID